MLTAKAVLQALEALANAETAAALSRFFKTGKGEYGEGDRFLGIKVPVQRGIAKEFARLPLREIEKLLHSPLHEARLTALIIAVNAFKKAGDAERKALFELYLRNTAHVNNWDLVDTSAPTLVGAYLGPGKHALLTKLAKSGSLWERRIAVLATAHFIGQGYYAETLRLAELLLRDEQDLIHKAVGWMLREVGKRDKAVELEFLRKHAARMPRTMLRYAIERLGESDRAWARVS